MLEASQGYHDLKSLLYERVRLGHCLELKDSCLGQAVQTFINLSFRIVSVFCLQLPLEQREDLFVDFVRGDWTSACTPVK